MAGPLVSVVVIFDRGEFEPCLSSLLSQMDADFEIIAVVGDKTDEAVAEGSLYMEDSGEVARDPRLRPLKVADRNAARRRNLAAEKARGKYLAFIDDDAFAPPDWLAKGVDFLESHPVYAGVGGPNLLPEESGPREKLTDMALTAPLLGAGSRAYRGGGSRALAKPGELHLVDLFVRKEVFDLTGGFNEALGYGAEDTEFLYLASRKGHAFIFDPHLYVFHKRRPFGMPYLLQRFRLRGQSGRLFAARPSVYARSAGFWAALCGPPLALALVLFLLVQGNLLMVAMLAALYAAASLALSAFSRRRPAHLIVSPAVFFLHHAANLAGLWHGLCRGLADKRDRKKIRRTP